jgi:hypothetical protein
MHQVVGSALSKSARELKAWNVELLQDLLI